MDARSAQAQKLRAVMRAKPRPATRNNGRTSEIVSPASCRPLSKLAGSTPFRPLIRQRYASVSVSRTVGRPQAKMSPPPNHRPRQDVNDAGEGCRLRTQGLGSVPRINGRGSRGGGRRPGRQRRRTVRIRLPGISGAGSNHSIAHYRDGPTDARNQPRATEKREPDGNTPRASAAAQAGDDAGPNRHLAATRNQATQEGVPKRLQSSLRPPPVRLTPTEPPRPAPPFAKSNRNTGPVLLPNSRLTLVAPMFRARRAQVTPRRRAIRKPNGIDR